MLISHGLLKASIKDFALKEPAQRSGGNKNLKIKFSLSEICQKLSLALRKL